MSSITGISQLSQLNQGRGSNNAMGKDQFLKLLVTQLKYQNPMKPMEDKEFIAQMAQFSSLEQMQNLNSNMDKFIGYQQLSQVSNLIDKKVTVLNANGNTITGKVERIDMSKESPQLIINGKEYSAESVQEILA